MKNDLCFLRTGFRKYIYIYFWSMEISVWYQMTNLQGKNKFSFDLGYILYSHKYTLLSLRHKTSMAEDYVWTVV